MSFLKYALPALAIAGSAAAICSTSATLTIQNGGDATALASCTTFTGSIALATGTTGSIAFDGIQAITGDFNAVNAVGLNTLSGSALTTIGGNFLLTNLTVLTGLNFPQLTNVGNLNWETLPQLQGLGFTNTIQTVKSLSIQDTQLATLTGINLTTADTIYISNNRYLAQIDMQLANVTNMLTLQANNNGGLTASFPDLIWTSSMTITNVQSLAIDALQYVTNTMYIVTDNIQTLSAPNLTRVGGLTIQNNPQLTNISFPLLSQCSNAGLVVEGNSAFTGNLTFPAMKTVAGAVVIQGAFSAFSLPAITRMAGIANLTSTANIASTCSAFQTYTGNGVLNKGNLYCTTGTSKTTTSGTATTTGSAATATTTQKSSAGRFEIAASAAMGFTALIVAAFTLF